MLLLTGLTSDSAAMLPGGCPKPRLRALFVFPLVFPLSSSSIIPQISGVVFLEGQCSLFCPSKWMTKGSGNTQTNIVEYFHQPLLFVVLI